MLHDSISTHCMLLCVICQLSASELRSRRILAIQSVMRTLSFEQAQLQSMARLRGHIAFIADLGSAVQYRRSRTSMTLCVNCMKLTYKI
jgi:hypothetical protein